MSGATTVYVDSIAEDAPVAYLEALIVEGTSPPCPPPLAPTVSRPCPLSTLRPPLIWAAGGPRCRSGTARDHGLVPGDEWEGPRGTGGASGASGKASGSHKRGHGSSA